MGALVAAATEAPITGILIVFEMTNDYAIVLPLMLATVIATVIARRLEPDSLYSGWLRRRGEKIAHGTDPDVLAGLRVADALDTSAPVIHENASVRELLVHLGAVAHTEFAVIDDEQRLLGMITIGDIGRAAHDHTNLAPLLVAADLASPTDSVEPGDSLLEAVRRLGLRGRSTIPVVEPGTDRLLGVTSQARILALYERAVASETQWRDLNEPPRNP
jgi:CIC family chloride channel protein